MPAAQGVSKKELKGQPDGAITLHGTLWITLAGEKALWGPKGAMPVGEKPGAIITVGESLWMVLAGEHALAQVDSTTGKVVQKVDLGAGVVPEGLTFDGSSLWVTDRANGTLLQRNLKTGAAMGSTPVGGSPRFAAAGPTGVWTVSTADGVLTHISTEPINGKVIGSKKSGKICNQPHDVAESARRIWVACYGDNAVVGVDPDTMTPGPKIELERADTLLPLGDSLIAAGQAGPRVLNIDSTSAQVRKKIEFGNSPAPAAAAPNAPDQPKVSLAMTGNHLYAAVNTENVVYRIAREGVGLPDTPNEG